MTQVRTPYGRHDKPVSSTALAVANKGTAIGPYRGESYYGLAAVKPSHYRWLIADYIFVGGMAGSAQVLATIADLTNRDRYPAVVRAGRYLALAGATLSPVFLIGDLHYRRRWYNMLRIFKSTSPMSIGSWTLTVFGTSSGLVAVCQLWQDATGSRLPRWLARIFEIPAGLAGALMSIYTGTLLAATSTPLWASAYKLLPPLFGASAASTATAALTLTLEAAGAPDEEQEPLERLGLAAGAAELALAFATRQKWREHGVDRVLQEEPTASALRVGAIGLGILVPIAVHGVQLLTGRRSRTARTLAAISTLIGGFCLRAAILRAGNESARRPQDYFRITQPHGAHALTDGTGGQLR